MMNHGKSTALYIVLGIALLATAWAASRLAQFQQTRQELVLYTDAPELQMSPRVPGCRQVRNFDLDIRDYSSNVAARPAPTPVYRYKTNLDAEPPVHVHILSIRGGSGRVVVSETNKPVWLVLISSQPAIWHIERAPGATLERVIASRAISELHFTDELVADTDSVFDLLLGDTPEAVGLPDVQLIPQTNCLANFPRSSYF